jgi:hypothetical protein
MLPLIEINYKKVCQIVQDYASPGYFRTVVKSFVCDCDKLSKEIAIINENEDRVFTQIVLSGIIEKQLRSNILFFFTPFSKMIKISVATLRMNTNFMWLRNLPGYSEYGQDYLVDIAKPFLFWDGNNLIRIYDIPDYDPNKYYINDFGSLYGLCSTETDPENYNDIKENRGKEYFDYSVVPKNPEETIIHNDKKYILLHRRYIISI